MKRSVYLPTFTFKPELHTVATLAYTTVERVVAVALPKEHKHSFTTLFTAYRHSLKCNGVIHKQLSTI